MKLTQAPYYFILMWVCAIQVHAQTIQGIIIDATDRKPIAGANIYWLHHQRGTVSDSLGRFALTRSPLRDRLLVSFVGYKSDTLTSDWEGILEIQLLPDNDLQTITIQDKHLQHIGTQQSEMLTTKSLRKAACCNLSESFETNASVDVSTTDAVSGAKQIRLLGLDGVYAQIMTENMPAVRGLAARSGVYFIPGTWVKSIEINKGVGSVVNGYESMTGQINVQLVSPDAPEKLFFNAYLNGGARWELNAYATQHYNQRWKAASLVHISNLPRFIDQNKDGYADVPAFTQANLVQRWQYQGEKMESQFGVKYLYDHKMGGQIATRHRQDFNNSNPYAVMQDAHRAEVWVKTGFFFGERSSLGTMISGLYHRQHNYFGVNQYQATQRYGYANAIFQTEFDHGHLLKVGASMVLDDYRQHYAQILPDAQHLSLNRTELVPGVFTEYSGTLRQKVSIIAGVRADFHNLYGNAVSPRLHLSYALSPTTTLRAAAGKGWRVANPLVEQANYLVSARGVDIAPNLQPERAWNMGGSLTQQFTLDYRKGNISLDFYHTVFQNQIITDVDSDIRRLRFYNLTGESWANSWQIQAEYELLKNLDVSFAYKNYNVQTTIGDTRRQVPFVARERWFTNWAYRTPKETWEFDLTVEWIGAQRLPATPTLVEAYSRPFALVAAQITRNFKKVEVYLGGENLTNVMQQNPIQEPQSPFGAGFDASRVYAPVMGAMLYAGVRWRVR